MADESAYKATFELIDTNGDGRISADELRQVMAALGRDISPETAAAGVGKFDADGDGQITLDEFASFMATLD